MKEYNENNRKMENLACIIRHIFVFEEKNNSYEDLKFIYDFVEEARRKEKIKEMDNKYIEFANKYKDKALEMNKEYGELY